MKHKKKCPNCKVKFQKVVKCVECGTLICKHCSINNICLDCHTKINFEYNKNEYFNEKRLKCEN